MPDDRSAFDVVIVGAGFAGMYMLHKVRQLGLSVRVIESAADVGGTWYWNRYPGARCDVESLEYSYSFDADLQQDWQWSERYSPQPEILAYANHVADRFELRNDIDFETRVESARWDSENDQWTVGLAGTSGDRDIEARFLVMATGCLSSPNKPDLSGLDQFKGRVLHTGEWPHQPIDFKGRNVGVIGTGSSAIQAIPVIASQCDSLTVFQRTANYSVPARNGLLDPEYEAKVKASYDTFRAENRLQPAAFGAWSDRNLNSYDTYSSDEQEQLLEQGWEIGGFRFLRSFGDVILNDNANRGVRQFVANKIRTIVADPGTADLLAPDQIIGCKRLCIDTNYFETFNLSHVSLIDIKANPVNRITETGLELRDGQQFEFDDLVLATGFDAMTGTILKVDIHGLNGAQLAQRWADGPKTYLGLMIPDFPNMFMITGPGSPSVLTNMIMAIEHHVEWIARCLNDMTEAKLDIIVPSSEAADEWVDHVNAVADQTLMTGCNSWYLGANIEGKSRVFMPLIGFPPYVEKCDDVAADGYRGFARR